MTSSDHVVDVEQVDVRVKRENSEADCYGDDEDKKWHTHSLAARARICQVPRTRKNQTVEAETGAA